MRYFLGAILFTLSSFLYANQHSSQMKDDYKFWEKHNPNWYLGSAAFVGDQLSAHSKNALESEVVNQTSFIFTTFKTHAVSVGYQIYLGYNVNPLLAAEVKFLQAVGPYKFTLNENFVSDPLDFQNEKHYQMKQIAFGPALLFSIPISRYFSPFFKGGVYAFRYHREYHYVAANTPPTTNDLKATYWDIRFIQGFGIKSQVAKWLDFRLEYECAINPILDTRLKLIMGNLNFGAAFNF